MQGKYADYLYSELLFIFVYVDIKIKTTRIFIRKATLVQLSI
jgi:hypothetical protein